MAPEIRSVSERVFNGSSSVISRPLLTTNGDLLLLIHSADNGSLDDMQISGGWQVAETAGGSAGNWAGTKIWKRIASNEPSTYTISQGGTADGVAVMLAISGAGTGLVVETISRSSQTIFIQTPAATPSTIGCLELRWAAGVRFASTSIEWFTPAGYDSLVELQSRTHATGVLTERALTGNAPVGVAEFLSSLGLNVWNGITILVPPPSGSGGPGGEPPPPTSPPPTIPAIPSGEQVVHYTYVFADLLTDHQICKDLDLYDVSYERRIIEAGTFSASLVVTDEATAAKVARIVPRHPDDLSTGPGRTVVHVYRNGVIWGSYVIWRASVSRSGRNSPIEVRIEGASLESYLSQVKIRSDLGPYEGIDQIDIARTLLNSMQATPRYDIGLVLQGGTSGVTHSAEYLASEASTYGERLAELSTNDPGFEWVIQVVDNGDGTRTKYWVWGYPKIGSPAAGHKFMEPGNVLSWSEDIDALRGGTTFQVRGESINDDASTISEPLVSNVVLAQAYIDAGWPGIDVTADRSGVSDLDVLNGYATWWAANRAGTVRVHQATVRLPANTTFGPGNLGDWVTVMLVNPWWPIVNGVASFAKSWRVVGMAFKPPSKGAGQEECTLVFEETVEEA
ncbi:hypothetical protein ACIBCT_21275 [Streptosporangium sp. NPDC050855]|uniref:hypothetical protein n=1 Tax=Streptosporangium sp. NPDC050855 TaxID=3366194 RepID=UPI0037AEDCB1